VEIVGEYRYVEAGQKIGNVVITVDVADRPPAMISILLIKLSAWVMAEATVGGRSAWPLRALVRDRLD
jgi:hypothetical protein